MREKIQKIIGYFKNLDRKKLALFGVSFASVVIVIVAGFFFSTETKEKAVQATSNNSSKAETQQSSILLFSDPETETEPTTETPSIIDLESLNVQDGDPAEDGKAVQSMGPDVIIAPRKIENVPEYFGFPAPMKLMARSESQTDSSSAQGSTESTVASTTDNTSTTESTTGTTGTTETTSSSTTENTTSSTSSPTEPTTQGTKIVPKGTLKNWQKAYENIYYFDSNNNPITGAQTIDTVKYQFNQHGAQACKTVIDVSSHNGTINWKEVKAAGVDCAIIRVGYRGYRNPSLNRDNMADKNIQGALVNGIQVGLYFYSQAITAEEAIEEASLTIDYAKRYKVTLPIYFDTEYSEADGEPGRADLLNKNQRTSIAQTFCNTVKGAGHQAGIYASKAFFYDDLNMNALSQYNIWLAHYTNSNTDFRYNYSMWQYSARGKVEGINTFVDVNIGLYDFEKGNDMSKLGESIKFV